MASTNAQQMFAYRVQKDLKEVNSMRFADSPAIAAAPVGDRIDHVVALAMGPSGTPYHCGFFFIEFRFTAAYPNEPPRCRFLSSDNGRVRMNPNLYADGKICLSILGTWRGEATEVWRGSYSIAYVLQAIQCVIMNSEPFYNEPGFEREALLRPSHNKQTAVATTTSAPLAKGDGSAATATPTTGGGGGGEGGDASDDPAKRRRTYTREELDAAVASYADKVTHETLRIAVCDVLEALLDIRSSLPSAPVPAEPAPAAAAAAAATSSASAEPSQSPESATGPVCFDASPGLTPVTADAAAAMPTATPPAAATEDDLDTAKAAIASSGAPTPSARHPLLAYFLPFRNEIVRQFVVRYEGYVSLARSCAARLDGSVFALQPFEFPNNCCAGSFDFLHLLRRLDRINRVLTAQTDAWRLKGQELTSRMAYVASAMAEERAMLDSLGLCISGGPVTEANLFHWQFTIMAAEGLFEESAFVIDAVFHPDLSESPRIRFMQPTFHPNISPSGVPFYFHSDSDVPLGRRFFPTAVAAALAKLIAGAPLVAPTTWVGEEAAALCFSADPEKQRAFRQRARMLARRTLEH